LAVAAAVLGGCSRGPSEEEQKLLDLQQQLADIEQLYTNLVAGRVEAETVAVEISEIEAVAENKRSEEQTARLVELTTRREQLTSERETTYEDLQARLQEFLNLALNELPQADETLKGLEIYSDEAILGAQEMVDAAGQYSQAIQRLNDAKTYYDAISQPVYQPLLDKIAELDEMQFITRERFDQVSKGMTEDEVKAVAGVPYHRNIREDPQRGVVFWVYPKREGGAAAIYFNKKDRVYEKNFDAIQTRVAG
jgi:hypothetical protein